MKISAMRRIDRWLGIPACWLLTGWRRAIDLYRRRFPRPSRTVRSILFVKLAEQGATVLADRAIRRAMELVGRENVYFLVFAENRFILDAMDVIPRDNVVAIPTRTFRQAVAGGWHAVRQMRRIRPDAAVDFEFFARSSAALCYLSGAPVRVGLHRFNDPAPYRGDLMTHRVRYNPSRHTQDAFATMVEAVRLAEGDMPDDVQLPAQADEMPLRFQPTPEELGEVRNLVESEAGACACRPLVLLNANASDLLPLRRWPAERYVGLAERLLASQPEAWIAFTGAPEEAESARYLAASVGSPRCFSLAGRTTLRQLLSLYHLADVLVTNDSGPAHFATLTPIQVVVLFGPETPALFGARSPRTEVLYSARDCSPCVSAFNNRLSTCRGNACMLDISVEQVFRAVAGCLEAVKNGYRQGSDGTSDSVSSSQPRT